MDDLSNKAKSLLKQCVARMARSADATSPNLSSLAHTCFAAKSEQVIAFLAERVALETYGHFSVRAVAVELLRELAEFIPQPVLYVVVCPANTAPGALKERKFSSQAYAIRRSQDGLTALDWIEPTTVERDRFLEKQKIDRERRWFEQSNIGFGLTHLLNQKLQDFLEASLAEATEEQAIDVTHHRKRGDTAAAYAALGIDFAEAFE